MMLWLEIIAFTFLILAVLAGLWRLYAGPTIPDRVVAADTLAIITTAGLVWLAHKLGNGVYLDIALVYGILSFVVVVVVAKIIEN
jgi:multicomponent Na+:H+ antiporter subunit F